MDTVTNISELSPLSKDICETIMILILTNVTF